MFIKNHENRYKLRHNLNFQTKNVDPVLPGFFFICNPKTEYYTPWRYEYNRNIFGFRSAEFHENTELLTLGCSHTFGFGMPLEHTWPSFVCDIIGIKDCANLAMPGASISFQVRLLANYINKYGSPKIVLANFPDLNRYEMVDDNGNIKWGSTKDVWFEDFSKSPAYAYFQNLQALNFLEAMCKSNNIKLVWQFWVGINNDSKGFGNLPVILDDDLKDQFSHCVDLRNENKWFVSHEFFKYNKKKKELVYSGETPLAPCCGDLYAKTKDHFYFAYDRYNVPSQYENIYIEKDLLENKLYETTSSNPGMGAHLGAHFHWHCAKNLAENI